MIALIPGHSMIGARVLAAEDTELSADDRIVGTITDMFVGDLCNVTWDRPRYCLTDELVTDTFEVLAGLILFSRSA